jgi:hypothetical protein
LFLLEMSVEGLRSLIVTSGEDIQQRIEECQTCRAISSFINLMGSSATVIVGLSLVQKYRNAKGDEVTMSSLIDFFDLPVRCIFSFTLFRFNSCD